MGLGPSLLESSLVGCQSVCCVPSQLVEAAVSLCSFLHSFRVCPGVLQCQQFPWNLVERGGALDDLGGWVALLSTGAVTFPWAGTCPPSLGPSDIHGDNAIIMGRRGIGGVVLALLGSISEGSIPLTSLVIAGVSAEGLLIEGSYVGLCI